jgi:hypothetical protein
VVVGIGGLETNMSCDELFLGPTEGRIRLIRQRKVGCRKVSEDQCTVDDEESGCCRS